MNKQFSELSTYSDEELIGLYRDGNDEVMEFLLEKYKHLVRSKAKTMFILGGDDQDLLQEGMIGLYKAVRDYDTGRDASFYTFADLCISRNIFSAVQKSNRKKNAPLNYYISLSETGNTKNEKGEDSAVTTFVQSLEHYAESDNNNPEKILIGREDVVDLENFISQQLSDLERQTMELFITGMSTVDIAKILGRDEKSTDNALQRAKSKIRKFLDGRE